MRSDLNGSSSGNGIPQTTTASSDSPAESTNAGHIEHDASPTVHHSPESLTITAQSDTHLLLPSTATLSTCTITNITSSIVDLSPPSRNSQALAGLTLKNIISSLIICGRVSGAIHVTGLKNTVIVVTCRQFRMHECTDCVVYLRVSSRPIIEDCEGERFAPLPSCLEVVCLCAWRYRRDG